MFVANLCGLICVYFFLIGGIALTTNEWAQLAPAMQIPMGWVYLVIPVSAGLMAIWMVIHTIEAAMKLRGERQP